MIFLQLFMLWLEVVFKYVNGNHFHLNIMACSSSFITRAVCTGEIEVIVK